MQFSRIWDASDNGDERQNTNTTRHSNVYVFVFIYTTPYSKCDGLTVGRDKVSDSQFLEECAALMILEKAVIRNDIQCPTRIAIDLFIMRFVTHTQNASEIVFSAHALHPQAYTDNKRLVDGMVDPSIRELLSQKRAFLPISGCSFLT